MMYTVCDLHRYTLVGRNSRGWHISGVAYLGGLQLSRERRYFGNFTVYNPAVTRVRSELKTALKSVKTPFAFTRYRMEIA